MQSTTDGSVKKGGVAVRGLKGFQKKGTALPPPKKFGSKKEAAADELRRRKRVEAARKHERTTKLVSLRFSHRTFADLEILAGVHGKQVATWIKALVDAAVIEAVKGFVYTERMGGATANHYGPFGLAKAREKRAKERAEKG